ncbi:hypothetical protein DVA43_07025 [Leclercia sp. W6]|uniref:hypothetical protein n=1 Tax=Leclercia sp. W6 TaxID=2282310 RepID=UPI000DF3DEDE|nr:hypothetical protein [Leclercia sp. W6]AXF59312.1 hypothetical protein DVA43_07025 [Leclercia sp. W6]
MTINKAFTPTGLGGDHPANGPLSVERLIRVRDELASSLEYAEGSNRDRMIADAVKAIHELLALRSVPLMPDGWAAVPVEPTEDMVIAGFEAELREEFRDPEAWEAFEAMSGCEQAAHQAKLCWSAMIAAAPQQV